MRYGEVETCNIYSILCCRNTLFPCLQWAVVGCVLHSDTVRHQQTLGSHALVLLTGVLGEAPLLGDYNLQGSMRNRMLKPT